MITLAIQFSYKLPQPQQTEGSFFIRAFILTNLNQQTNENRFNMHKVYML